MKWGSRPRILDRRELGHLQEWQVPETSQTRLYDVDMPPMKALGITKKFV